VTPPRFIALVLVTALSLCALCALCARAFARQDEPRLVRAADGVSAARVVRLWNDGLHRSIARQNVALTALNRSLRERPPWRVLDAAEFARQQEAARVVRDEARRQLEAAEALCEEFACDDR
jgi:hypothetical protein